MNKPRLIDADELSRKFDEEGADIVDSGCPPIWGFGYRLVHDLIGNAPTIDAVPVVRCRDCRYFEYNHFEKVNDFPVPLIVAHEICTRWSDGCKTSEDGFCFMGERRTGD